MNAVEKKTTRDRLLTALAAFLLGSFSLTPVYASDTEVYARLIEIDSADAAPSLMMMLDSSLFMNHCMASTATNPSGSDCADENDMRINHMRRAMRKALFGNHIAADGDIIKPAPGFLRLGYSRFLNSGSGGGWVRYPALALDDLAPTTAGAGFPAQVWTARVVNSQSDGQCTALTEGLIPPLACTMNTTAVDFTISKTAPATGLRFENLNIPKNATITSANLTLTVKSTVGNSAQSPIFYVDPEMSGESESFATQALNLRNYVNNATAKTAGTATITTSVTAQVQAIVNQADWCGRNALGLRLRPSPTLGGAGTRTYYSYDGTTAGTSTDINRRPRLVINWSLTDPVKLGDSCQKVALDSVALVDSVWDDIEWQDGSPAVQPRNNTLKAAAIFEGNKNQVAVRFDQLQVARNAAVQYARLYSTLSSGESDSEEPVIDVKGIKEGNIGRFCNPDVKPVVCTVPSASRTTAASTFSIPNFLDVDGNPVSTGKNFVADVTGVVQEVVNQGTWNQGNTMGFVLQNNGATSTLRGLAAADSGLSKSMVLHVRALSAITDLNNLRKTVRQDLVEDIESLMVPDGGTPLGAGFQEAGRYLLGMAPADTATGIVLPGLVETFNAPDTRTIKDGKYLTPVDRTGESCSAAYVFALTSGYAQSMAGVGTKTGEVLAATPKTPGVTKCGDGFTFPVGYTLTGNDDGNLECMGSMAKYMYTKDLRNPADFPDSYKPIIRTSTVLFNGDTAGQQQMVLGMKAVAQAGGGTAYVAVDEDSLLEALLDTLRSVIEKTGSITAPGVAVNQFNRLTHLDQLYYAVFDPDQGNSRWRGNVKRYRLKFTETEAFIVDKSDNPAIDADTFFSDDAWSFWSPIKDGKNTSLGGVGSKLPTPSTRKIYTSFPDYVRPSSGDIALTTLNTTNATVIASSKATMGLSDDNQVKNVLNWLLGYDLTVADSTNASLVKSTLLSTTGVGQRHALGGVLHSQPVLINFGFDTDYTANEAAANPDLQKNYLFFSTMEGMLHAVDTNSASGTEKFAFMPREALANADEQALNIPSDLPFFGLDLTWTVMRVDGDKDLQITGNGASGDDDKVWLFGGMRMGGSNYYALNVTDLDSPRLKWVIEGGSGEFAFFAGGYDEKHEVEGYNPATSTSDDLGNQLYVVDPDTGEVLFWASGTGSGAHLESADLKYSIPSEVKIFDANKDGLVDAVYVGDMGGQVLRLDINNSATTGKDLGLRVKLLATIGQDIVADTLNQRRFYEAPSVATMIDAATRQTYVIVAMGSGYRSHPLNESTEDAFYVFRDNDVLRKDLVTATDLQDTIKPDSLASVDPASKDAVDVTGKMGWMMYLPDDGEKVMAAPILLFGEAFFTSYVPRQSLTSNKCSPVIGVTKLWRMNAFDAAVVRDTNKDGEVTAEDRFQDNLVEGLGGAPQLLVGEDGKNAIIAGTGVERNSDLSSANMRRTRWFEKTKR
ncbi:MAG: Tfp pilus assembly protein tip-associated adhesin PilY1-like protein [Moraxellaceae bacterium]|nr:Tfp pilus assembly protein tip-associated adhesin PilY1-like protein [Moraxellaceae bacterium]